MTLPTDNIIRLLPGLRRYACALTGSTRSGDQYIRVALEAVVEEPWRLPPASGVKPELYALFHRALQSCNFQGLGKPALEGTVDVQRRLLQLSLRNRKLLLLVDLEGFPLREAAELLRLTPTEAEWRLAVSRRALRTPQRDVARERARRRARRWISAARWMRRMIGTNASGSAVY